MSTFPDRRPRTGHCPSGGSSARRRRFAVRGWSCFLFIAVLLVAGLAVATEAGAQEPAVPVIDLLEVDLWPEYDAPRLLVIYQGGLATVPNEPLRFPISATAEVNAVAYLNDEDRLISLDWDLTEEGDKQVISFMPPAANFQFEYYTDVIGGGPDKSFTLKVDVDGQTVNQLGISVQQPAGASNLQGTPPLSEPVVGFQGLSYYTRQLQDVEPGTVVQQTVTYTKANDALTINQVEPAVSEAVEQAPAPTVDASESSFGTNLAGRSMTAFWLPVGATVIILLGLVFIGIGAWRERRLGVEPLQPARSRRSRRARPRDTSTGEGPAQFCHSCGAPFETGDRFCAECGAQRRGA